VVNRNVTIENMTSLCKKSKRLKSLFKNKISGDSLVEEIAFKSALLQIEIIQQESPILNG
jgi:hypothetical protein